MTTETLSRTAHPETSKQAARELVESGKLADRQREALAVLMQHPGSTSTELDRWAGYTDGVIRKRLNDLRARGWAYVNGERKCRVTGRSAQLWFPSSEGEKVGKGNG